MWHKRRNVCGYMSSGLFLAGRLEQGRRWCHVRGQVLMNESVTKSRTQKKKWQSTSQTGFQATCPFEFPLLQNKQGINQNEYLAKNVCKSAFSASRGCWSSLQLNHQDKWNRQRGNLAYLLVRWWNGRCWANDPVGQDLGEDESSLCRRASKVVLQVLCRGHLELEQDTHNQ
jgi:hypothetical protein